MAIYFPPVSGRIVQYDDSGNSLYIGTRELLQKRLTDPNNEDIFVFVIPRKDPYGKSDYYLNLFKSSIEGLEEHICLELTELTNFYYPSIPGKISVCIMTRGGRENKSRVKLLESKVN